MHKNTAVPIIVMLGYLEVDTKVSDAGMKTTGFDDCREVLGDDRDTNDVLAVM